MNTRIVFGLVAAVALLLVRPQTASADGDEDRSANWSKPRVEARVESRFDGVYVQIEARQTTPGIELADIGRSTSTGSSTDSTASAGSTSGSAASSGHTWTDRTGIHHETADGQYVYLTPQNISHFRAKFWDRELPKHPDEDPWLIYTDGAFGGLIWLPRWANADDLRFGAPPATTSPEVAVPAGGGGSIDPREVALDALAHVPLPDIQMRMNPSLGLVGLPGWFWVERYGGQSFGTSRTLDVPPAVGPDVPADVVPADDPRRRASSHTVEVRVWGSSYEWRFGDGANQVTQSLGQPYPAESDIQHTYEQSSLPFPHGFPVRLTVEYRAEFRVDGGGLQSLPSIRRSYEAGYRVQEAQAVLTSR